MELEFNALSIIRTKYGDLSMHEDLGQECLHIWVDGIEPVIEVDDNHIRIKPIKQKI